MNIKSAFPSKYLQASDLQGQEVGVQMAGVATETIGQDSRPVLHFVGKSKGLVLNKTNATMIALSYGDETDAWRGQAITLFPTETDYQGKRVACIRVKVLATTPPFAGQAAADVPDIDPADAAGDEVPF